MICFAKTLTWVSYSSTLTN